MTVISQSFSKKIVFVGIALCCLLFFASRADAQIANTAMADLYNSLMDTCNEWLQKAGEIALGILCTTAVIGFAISVKDLAISGQVTMDGVVALFVRHSFIVGLIVWLLQAPQRLALITLSIKKIGTEISGQDISFGGLMSLFSDVVSPLAEFTMGLGWRDIGLIICMAFIIFLINCLFFMIASTVLVVEIEAIFILIGGLFTASFFVIGYFRDYFLSYIKALVSVGVKMLMLCLCLGTMRNIMSSWPGMIAAQLDDAGSVFSFLMPMACALLGFYAILKAVPQFASSVLTGSASGVDGGGIRTAAAIGYGMGKTILSTSYKGGKKLAGGASNVGQAIQAYNHTSQAARDTGSTPGAARAAGAWEAIKTVMGGSSPGGPRAAGDRIYADHQKAAEFADVRAGTNANSISAPSGKNATPSASQASASQQASQKASNESVTIAGSQSTASHAAASQSTASQASSASYKDDWGVFASDRDKGKR